MDCFLRDMAYFCIDIYHTLDFEQARPRNICLYHSHIDNYSAGYEFGMEQGTA